MNELVKQLAGEFKDGEYAHSYMTENANMRIAAQVRAIRQQRGWSQNELATRAGMAQERISKIESGDFQSLTLKTLRAIAKAFDIHLLATFVPFSAAILDFVALSPEWLQCEPRQSDLSSFVAMIPGNFLITKTSTAIEKEDNQLDIVFDNSIGLSNTQEMKTRLVAPGEYIAWTSHDEIYFSNQGSIEPNYIVANKYGN